MPGKIRVAAAHPPHWRSVPYKLGRDEALERVGENADEILGLADAAADRGAVCVAFPEDTLGLLGWQSAHFDEQEQLVEPAVEMLLGAASKKAAERSVYMIVCTDIFCGDEMSNTSILFGRYRKVNLPLSERNKKAGDSFPVFETEELGGVGMCICYDMVFPETTRALALGGADVVFHLTMGGAACPGEEASRAAFVARAAENELYIVVAWRGRSTVIAPSGAILARAKEGDELVVAELDPRAGREFGDACGGTFPDHRARLFRERVPGAYAILTDPNPPALGKFEGVELPSPDEAARLAAEVLTTGEERFTAAQKLLKTGRRGEARREFEEMADHFKTTWIGRADSGAASGAAITGSAVIGSEAVTG